MAIFDILEHNHFRLTDGTQGPYRIALSAGDRGVLFTITNAASAPLRVLDVSLRPLRRNIRDYFMICENYFAAIRHGLPDQIEAIDKSRRALHNESGTMLKAAMAEVVELDDTTARRLFTLISVLHLRA